LLPDAFTFAPLAASSIEVEMPDRPHSTSQEGCQRNQSLISALLPSLFLHSSVAIMNLLKTIRKPLDCFYKIYAIRREKTVNVNMLN